MLCRRTTCTLSYNSTFPIYLGTTLLSSIESGYIAQVQLTKDALRSETSLIACLTYCILHLLHTKSVLRPPSLLKVINFKGSMQPHLLHTEIC